MTNVLLTTQVPPALRLGKHVFSPGGQVGGVAVQVPWTQLGAVGRHTLPQVLQLFGSLARVCMSKQASSGEQGEDVDGTIKTCTGFRELLHTMFIIDVIRVWSVHIDTPKYSLKHVAC